MKNNIITCKYCKRVRIIFLTNQKGHSIPVEYDSLSIGEKQSFMMQLVIPYDAINHNGHNCRKNK